MTKFLTSIAAAAVAVSLAVTLAGCGNTTTTATPVHVVNTWIGNLHAANFGAACNQIDLKVFGGRRENCEGYFIMIAATTGSLPTGRAVPHSEKVTGDTATVKVVLSGQPGVAQLRRTKTGWKLESVQSS